MNFKEHLKKYLNNDEIENLITSLEQKPKKGLIVNTVKTNSDLIKENYPNIISHPIVNNAFIFDQEEYQLGKSLLHELGAFYIQEPSAMLPAFLLNPKENEYVLDLCAAPGGKTVQMSCLMKGKGLILSNDISHSRAVIIKENIERLGIGNVVITNNDFSKIQNTSNTFDKIMLDAPCSGSGMFRKEEKMKDDWTYEKVLKCASLQKELILLAYKMLKPGGLLCYSTCSFSYEEDEEVIEHLLSNSDAQIQEINNNPLYYVSKSKLGMHLLPNIFPGEGHYICLINKPGEITSSNKKVSKCVFSNQAYLSYDLLPIKNLSYIRNGIKIGDVLDFGYKYDYHYAKYVDEFEQILELNLDQAIQYISGDSLNISFPKGFVLLKYKGINIDIAKSDGRIIKNRYPSYLRKRLNK